MHLTPQQAAERAADQQNEAENLRNALRNLVNAIDEEIFYPLDCEQMVAAMRRARLILSN